MNESQMVDVGMSLFQEIFDRISDSEGMSQEYKNSLKLEKDGNSFSVHLDYRGDNDEPLGFWLEGGTRRHFVEPKEGGVLSWLDGGTRHFSRGHWVSGLEGKMVMEKSAEEFKSRFQQRLQNEHI